jgi:hypothetical protein
LASELLAGEGVVEAPMRRLDLSYREFGFTVATRAALGAGLGLLLSDRLGRRKRRLGKTLVALGALSTIPALFTLLGARYTEKTKVAA